MALFLIGSFLFLNKLPLTNSNCQNVIFCTGELLHTIQTAGIFKDSKTFVDMNLIHSVADTIEHFDRMMSRTNSKPSLEHIKHFITDHFQAEDSELELWRPKDFDHNPQFLQKIDDGEVRSFAKSLVHIWLTLGRRIKLEVFKNLEKYSIIPLRNGFIIPGGRFRETYYWDSFWIIKGLLVCDMENTAKGMLENFFAVIELYGFVPNGGRIYYLDRSQPPVLTLMTNEYIKYTNDYIWLRQNIKFLERELQFWIENKMIELYKNNKMYNMAVYQSFADEPRPESYIEDIHTATYYSSPKEQRRCYREIRSGAETGWDFSTRWFFEVEEGVQANLSSIAVSRIVPVDLNSILAASFRVMSDFFQRFREPHKAIYWQELAVQLENAIEAVLYSPEEGVWFDYDKKLGQPRKFFFASNLVPLWTTSFNQSFYTKHGTAAVEYLRKNNILEFNGGIPMSLEDTGEQWDFPNAWAPLQSMIIFGLEKVGDVVTKQVARELAKKWIMSNMKTHEVAKEMFEKYNAVHAGIQGGGGEYEVQTGFGWSNGVILELIDYFYVKNKYL